MTLRRTNLIGWAVVCVVAFFAAGGAAQQPTLGPAPTTHVPIALPIEAPSGFDPVAWATFRQRCQEVADMSAANLPMGSGDYGYADACTKQGAYFHPVKQRPKPPAVPTVTVTPGPDGHIPLDIPSSPPPRSSYYRQPDVWARILRMCQEVADRQYQNQPVDHSAWLECGSIRAMVHEQLESDNPGLHKPAAPEGNPATLKLMPTPTPTPPGNPSSPQSLNPSSSAGPFGTSFAGGGADACASGGEQPPDVAADVSATQVVQMLNQGIWVFNKQGQVQSGYPKTLATFWAPNSPPPTNILTDTQVAYDPLAQRWMTTTLSNTPKGDNGDLYFAISNTTDATGAWTIYNFPRFCSAVNNTYPGPDQEILGYNQRWVVIDVSCFTPSGIPLTDHDQLLLIPHVVIALHPARLNAIQEQGPTGTLADGWFASRPSRDPSGSAGQNIFLVSSGPLNSPGLADFVKVTSIDSRGNLIGPGPGGSIVQSPINGVPTGGYFNITDAQHDNCGVSSTCVIRLFDDRITNAPVLQTGNDGKHYLLTSFHAGDQANSTAQALWFIGQTDSFATSALWDELYADGPGFWAAYPTITMDKDLDEAFTFTTFAPNSTIYPNWFTTKGFVPTAPAQWPPFLGSGILYSANSAGSYIGQQLCIPSSTFQRWGDYMTTLWDPNFASPNESDAFWTVQEYTTGGSNQSTQFAPLQDPLPFFAGYSIPVAPNGNPGENELCSGAVNCHLTYTVPSGAQSGDLLVAIIAIGESSNGSFFNAPSGWTLMKLANHQNGKV